MIGIFRVENITDFILTSVKRPKISYEFISMISHFKVDPAVYFTFTLSSEGATDERDFIQLL